MSENHKVITLVILSIFFLFSTCTKKTVPQATTSPTKIFPKKQTPASPPKRPELDMLKDMKADAQIQSFINNSSWVDSVFNSLTLDERIGQLIMFDAYSNQGKKHLDSLTSLVKKYKIGGLIFLQGGPGRQIKMINHLQKNAPVPLLIAMDAEYGVGMRLDSCTRFPFQMTLGAVQDNTLIYQMGKAIAKDIKRVGMQVNFAPVLDINNNPKNPIIGMRSFGEDKYNVTAKCLAYVNGLQENNVLATAKHFPGHGDTHIDSHRDLPLISSNRERLDTVELYPFKQLIKEGLGGVMVAHMNIPALDATYKLPTTLSKPVVTGLLKKELGFKGIVFTDAMVMEGLTKFYPAGVAEPMAIIAGNDILEKMKDAKLAIRSIKQAIDNKKISLEEINEKCKKVLAVKRWVGLHKYLPINMKNIYSDLNSQKSDSLITKLIEGSATLLRNAESILPIKKNMEQKIASLSISSSGISIFQNSLSSQIPMDQFFLPSKSTSARINLLSKSLEAYDLVIVGIHDQRNLPGFTLSYSIQIKNLISNLIKSKKTVISFFGNPYALNSLPGIEKSKGLLMMYENSKYTQQVAARVIWGKIKSKGKLPVTVNAQFILGAGITE